MTRILVTQRVDEIGDYAERRDALDQRWVELILQAGLQPVLVPNSRRWLDAFLAREGFEGLLLTGGNSLVGCGGTAPERDEVEKQLLHFALEHNVPVLGVCRGMQVIMDHYGAELVPVKGHVAAEKVIDIDGKATVVNSYHDWGSTAAPKELEAWARTTDGVIKAVRHRSLPVCGIMWHPERLSPFRDDDIALLQSVLGPKETP